MTNEHKTIIDLKLRCKGLTERNKELKIKVKKLTLLSQRLVKAIESYEDKSFKKQGDRV